jgi:hypothetical protein
MSPREIKLVWNNTSIAAPAKNQKPKPEERTSASDSLFKLVGAGGSIVIVLGFAFWLGVLSNSITARNTLFTEKLTTFTKQLDRIEKDLDGVKEAQYFPKAKEIGIPNPKISFARARATETFNVSYPGVERENRPPIDVTFRIEAIGDNFVKLKPQVFLRRGDTVRPLPDKYPLITVHTSKSVGINFLVEVDDLPGAISGFAGKYVAVVMIGLLDKLPRNLVFASQRLESETTT